MPVDAQVGRVVSVDTAELTIELDPELRSLTRATYEGAVDVGRINSYVLIPAGAEHILAMVTRVQMTQVAEVKPEDQSIMLPQARRLMRATMIGTISSGRFLQGVTAFPLLDSPVLLLSRRDLVAIFGDPMRRDSGTRFRVPVGQASVFPDFTVNIDPNVFFGKHAAVLGSTGSGKSCTIATILQSVLEDGSVKHARFIILDTNGEYREAFPPGEDDEKALYIASDPRDESRLAIPYWFMGSEDLTRIFRASPGVQRPVLMEAVRAARERASGSVASWRSIRDDLLLYANRVLGLATDASAARQIRQICDQTLSVLRSEAARGPGDDLCALLGNPWDMEAIVTAFEDVKRTVRDGIRDEGGQYERYEQIGPGRRRTVEAEMQPLIDALGALLPPEDEAVGRLSADSPTYFSKLGFWNQYLPRAMTRQEGGTARVRENSATMLMRIQRLLEDRRFEFLFGPVESEWPEPKHSLAAFLRDVTGVGPGQVQLSPEGEVPQNLLPFYDRQRRSRVESSQQSNVVIVDLSLLAAEVLENVTALIGRLLLEFLQRLTTARETGAGRGEFPVVLILEEAQNYIRDSRGGDEESVARHVFERVAREGRKYGLGLVVASQRPSELSKTVLSQCHSFVVHRLQNPEDLRYFKEIVPGAYAPLLSQLPALAPRSALVLGEAVSAPALVLMREARPLPSSADPELWKRWTEDGPPIPHFERIARGWEGSAVEKEDEEI